MNNSRIAAVVPRSAAVAIALALTLTACDSGDSTDTSTATTAASSSAEESSEAPTTEQPSSEASETETSEATESSAAAAEGTEVEIGKEFTDNETGDVITIVSAVRNNPTEYYEINSNPDGEMVYVQVKVVPGEKFGGTIASSDFFIDSDGEQASYASSASGELEKAGYDYFDYASRRDGEHAGYVPIFVAKPSDTLKGTYVRQEAKVLGEDKTIPEFTADFEVPAS